MSSPVVEIDLDQLSNISSFVVATDKNLTITWAGGSVLEMAEAVVGRNVHDIFEWIEPGPEVSSFSPINNIGIRHEISLKGREAHLSLTGQWMETGSGFVLLAEPDLRSRKELSASADKKLDREKFRAIFHGVTEGLLLADPKTRCFTMANRAICEMLGYSEEEIGKLDVSDIHPTDELPKLEPAFENLRSGKIQLASDVPVKRKDGSVFLADISLASVEIRDSYLLLGCFRDVSERHNLRAGLVQAERFSSIGVLASGVAHELNNPLSYVIYDLELLLEDLPKLRKTLQPERADFESRHGECPRANSNPREQRLLFDEIQRRLKDVFEGARRIGAIVRGLSTFSRVDKTHEAPVDIAEILDRTTSMASNEIKYRARLVKDYAVVPLVTVSEGALFQVFLNLILNAAQAIDEGAVAQNEISLRTWTEDDHVCVEVKDTGSGIKPEHLSRIFDPFFTTKEVGEGSGLGLSISKNIVESFGGTLSATGEPGKGSRFVVRLPAEKPVTETPIKISKTIEPGMSKRGRVLFVDDEKLICQAVKRMLKTHEVVIANSGRHAQTILEADDDFDVIVSDVMMKDLSGIDLHQWLAVRNPGLAKEMIFITGGAFTSRARKYLEALNNTRLEKPIEVEVLIEIVEERIESNSGRTNPL